MAGYLDRNYWQTSGQNQAQAPQAQQAAPGMDLSMLGMLLPMLTGGQQQQPSALQSVKDAGSEAWDTGKYIANSAKNYFANGDYVGDITNTVTSPKDSGFVGSMLDPTQAVGGTYGLAGDYLSGNLDGFATNAMGLASAGIAGAGTYGLGRGLYQGVNAARNVAGTAAKLKAGGDAFRTGAGAGARMLFGTADASKNIWQPMNLAQNAGRTAKTWGRTKQLLGAAGRTLGKTLGPASIGLSGAQDLYNTGNMLMGGQKQYMASSMGGRMAEQGLGDLADIANIVMYTGGAGLVPALAWKGANNALQVGSGLYHLNNDVNAARHSRNQAIQRGFDAADRFNPNNTYDQNVWNSMAETTQPGFFGGQASYDDFNEAQQQQIGKLMSDMNTNTNLRQRKGLTMRMNTLSDTDMGSGQELYQNLNQNLGNTNTRAYDWSDQLANVYNSAQGAKTQQEYDHFFNKYKEMSGNDAEENWKYLTEQNTYTGSNPVKGFGHKFNAPTPVKPVKPTAPKPTAPSSSAMAPKQKNIPKTIEGG